MTQALLTQLQQGSETMNLSLSDEQQQALIAYVTLLVKWNKVYNLTSIRKPEEMISRHILDSLSIAPYITGTSLLDVGTGAGLPGIPLAIMYPEMQVTLLDTNSKKTRFLQQVKAELALKNITIVHARVEEADLGKFDIVTTRAFASVTDIINLAGQHCAEKGTLMLMQGVAPQDELAAMQGDFKVQDMISLTVPDCDGQRHLLRLVKG